VSSCWIMELSGYHDENFLHALDMEGVQVNREVHTIPRDLIHVKSYIEKSCFVVSYSFPQLPNMVVGHSLACKTRLSKTNLVVVTHHS